MNRVIRKAFRLLKRQDEIRAMRLQELKRDIAAGLDQLDRGQSSDLDIVAVKAKARKQIG